MHDRSVGRYPGYDVLRKRDTPSWNEQTRKVIDARLAVPPRTPRFFTGHEFATVEAIAARLVPQPADGRPQIPVAALVDQKLHQGKGDGYRGLGMPREHEAWRRGLRALDKEAQDAHGADFIDLPADAQDALLRRMEQGELKHPAWEGMPSKTFFQQRMGHDVVLAYYSHPTAWNQIGWGGPASPRGYVRTGYNERDPWEAAEAKPGAKPGQEEKARRENSRVG